MCWMKGVNYTAGNMADFWLIMSSMFNIFIFVRIIKVVLTNQMAWSECRLITKYKWKSVTDAGAHISNDDFRKGMQIYCFVLCSTICFDWLFIVIIGRKKKEWAPLLWEMASVSLDWSVCLKIVKQEGIDFPQTFTRPVSSESGTIWKSLFC